MKRYGVSLLDDLSGAMSKSKLGEKLHNLCWAINGNLTLKNGTKFSGAAGLRMYLLETRRDDFVRHFCRKLLGYALARGVQLSDEPLLDDMLTQLKANDYRFAAAVETILRSQQFRYQRGQNTE